MIARLWGMVLYPTLLLGACRIANKGASPDPDRTAAHGSEARGGTMTHTVSVSIAFGDRNNVGGGISHT